MRQLTLTVRINLIPPEIIVVIPTVPDVPQPKKEG